MQRITPVNPDNAPDEIQQVYDELKEKKWRIPIMYQILAHNPKIMMAHEQYFDVVMNKGILDRKTKEKIAFKVARLHHNEYSTASHHRYALKCGATVEEMDAIDTMKTDLLSDKEIAVINLAIAMSAPGNSVSDEIFNEIKKYYSESEIIEIVATIGLMTLASKYAETFGLEAE